MGRRMDLYGVQVEKAQTLFPPLFQQYLPQLQQFMGSEKNAKMLFQRLCDDLTPLLPDDWFWLIRIYNEEWYGIEDKKRKKAESLDKMGIVELFNTSATNPSCVFMEQFIDWRDETGAVFETCKEHYTHKISSGLFKAFLQRFAELLRVFRKNTDDNCSYFEYDEPNAHTQWAEAFFWNQEKWRKANPKSYSDKWATDYFAFSHYYEAIDKIAQNADDYDFFLILDSY